MVDRVSDLIEQHAMTLRNGAMVCKAGDWPDNPDPMPDDDDPEGTPFTQARMEYAVDRVVGHQQHLATVVDAAQARTWQEGKDSGHEPTCRLNANRCTCHNPYATQEA